MVIKKRAINIIISLTFILLFFPLVNSSELVIDFNSGEGNQNLYVVNEVVGETITASFFLKDFVDLNGYEINVFYDEEKLQHISSSIEGHPFQNEMHFLITRDNKIIMVVDGEDELVSGEETYLGKMIFEVLQESLTNLTFGTNLINVGLPGEIQSPDYLPYYVINSGEEVLDCDAYDGWYDFGNSQFVDTGQCTEKEQTEKEERNYFYTGSECDYILTGNTQWVDGDETPKSDGETCDDGLYCTVNDVCSSGVCGGSARDCSVNDILGINTCDNNPDGNDLTLDFFAGFNSVCDEDLDVCTLYFNWENWMDDITHTCSFGCGAECEIDSDCGATLCQDTCIGLNYYDYDNVENSCEIGICQNNSCGAPTIFTDDDRCIEPCFPDWSLWEGECINGLQEIDWVDLNSCGTLEGKPAEATIEVCEFEIEEQETIVQEEIELDINLGTTQSAKIEITKTEDNPVEVEIEDKAGISFINMHIQEQYQNFL